MNTCNLNLCVVLLSDMCNNLSRITMLDALIIDKSHNYPSRLK